MPDGDRLELPSAFGAFCAFTRGLELSTGVYREGSAHLRRSLHQLGAITWPLERQKSWSAGQA